MTAAEELINYIMNFTPDQLEQFLNHETTLLILQPEGASESYLPAVPLSAQ
jgi:hypothetical protein